MRVLGILGIGIIDLFKVPQKSAFEQKRKTNSWQKQDKRDQNKETLGKRALFCFHTLYEQVQDVYVKTRSFMKAIMILAGRTTKKMMLTIHEHTTKVIVFCEVHTMRIFDYG